jgi:CyaY protein
MDENLFNGVADRELADIAKAVDEAGLDCDAEFKAAGVLELVFEDDTRIIINRHSAAREIWVAAKSGGFHFRPDDGGWVDTRSGRRLRDALDELLSAGLGEPVSLRYSQG